MQKSAEEFAEADKKRKEEVEIVNQADATVYQTEKMLDDMKDKISASNKTLVESGLKELKELLGTEPKPVAKLKTKLEQFNKDLMKIGQDIYSKSGAGNAQSGNMGGTHETRETSESGNDSDAVDADFKVNEDK
jgi:molecular chaperone DnaK